MIRPDRKFTLSSLTEFTTASKSRKDDSPGIGRCIEQCPRITWPHHLFCTRLILKRSGVWSFEAKWAVTTKVI